MASDAGESRCFRFEWRSYGARDRTDCLGFSSEGREALDEDQKGEDGQISSFSGGKMSFCARSEAKMDLNSIILIPTSDFDLT